MIPTSVIIPTYNGAYKVLNCLKALEQQTTKEFETIVVVDGSTDNTIEVLKGNTFSLSLKIHYRENGGRSVARNSGVQEANGELIIFLDDDMRATANLVEEHIKFHKKNKGILVGVPKEEPSVMKTDFQKFKAHLSEKWMNELGSTTVKLEHSFLTSANCSIPKIIFERLKGFDENLTDAEDYDLAVKAQEQNIDIYFEPNAIAWHDDFITCKSYIKRLREYHKAHQKLNELYPERHTKIISKIDKSILKSIVFSFFSFDFWQILIDRNRLRFLPLKIRYKIYDWVITSQSS